MPEEANGDESVSTPEELCAFETEFLSAHGPIPPLDVCPIGWQPSGLTPVFYGFRDYDETQGAPGKVRVFFPSLDGSPQHADVLQGCGRYPVVLFVHGDCEGDPDHYLRWFQLPAQLARAGYVVAVPQLPGIIAGNQPFEDQGTQATLAAVLTWIRQGWDYRGTLLPEPATGLAGHSFGALHVGFLATTTETAGVVSLSGVWGDWPDSPPIWGLRVPQLFTWGTADLPTAMLSGDLWNPIARPKHRAIFTGGEHFDYLYTAQLPCRQYPGTCQWVGLAATDLVTMFFANYLPPELWPNLPSLVPDTLIPPQLNLTLQQEFYAGAYLIGVQIFDEASNCGVEITQELPTDRIVPYVLYTPRNLAVQLVRQRNLAPVIIGPSGPSGPGVQWVRSQSPLAGRTVPAGTQVRMTLQTGPIP
jgi:hypothetical protein